MNQGMSLAIQQYIYARLLTEQFIVTDFNEDTSLPEVEALLAEAVQAWDDAETMLAGAEDLVSSAQILMDVEADSAGKGVSDESAAPADQSLDGGFAAEPVAAHPAAVPPASGHPVASAMPTMVPCADPKMDPKAWAEDFTSRYDALSGSKRLQTLAQQMNLDVKQAHEQLEAAQEIIHSGATKDAAFWDKMTKAAMATKTAAKVGLFVTSTIATAGGSLGALATGSATLTQAGGILVSGVDTVIEVGATTSAIVLGEDHKVTASMNNIQDVTGPLATGFGVMFPTFGGSDEALGGAIANLGGVVMDLLGEKRVAGWNVKMLSGKSKAAAKPAPDKAPADAKTPAQVTPSESAPPLGPGETEITMASVPTGEDVAQTNKNLEAAGFPPLPVEEPTTTLEEATQEVAPDPVEAAAQMEDLMTRMEEALSQVQEALIQAALKDIPGTYEVTESVVMDGDPLGPYTFQAVITLEGTNMTMAFSGEHTDVLTGTFDPETATFVGINQNMPDTSGPAEYSDEGFSQQMSAIMSMTDYMMAPTALVFDLGAYPLTATGGLVYQGDEFMGLEWTTTRDLTLVRTGD